MRTYGYGTRETTEDSERCIKSVYSGSAMGGHKQCSRRRGHGEGGLYCKQHDPERIAQKHEERMEEIKRFNVTRQRHHQKPRAYEEALRKIAKGELNDPAGYAQMILDEWSSPDSGTTQKGEAQ